MFFLLRSISHNEGGGGRHGQGDTDSDGLPETLLRYRVERFYTNIIYSLHSPYSISIDNEISCGQFYQLPQKLQIFGKTETACMYLPVSMSISFCHVLLFHGSNTRICFDVICILRDLSYRICPPRKYSKGVQVYIVQHTLQYCVQ